MTPDQRELYLKSLEDDAEKRPAVLRRWFTKKHDKYADSIQYLKRTETIQQHMQNIDGFVKKEKQLLPAEIAALREKLLSAIAAMQLQETQ
jgi:hypothetical protein